MTPAAESAVYFVVLVTVVWRTGWGIEAASVAIAVVVCFGLSFAATAARNWWALARDERRWEKSALARGYRRTADGEWEKPCAGCGGFLALEAYGCGARGREVAG
jgi:hypothetical protein